jgi:hypothetical protein
MKSAICCFAWASAILFAMSASRGQFTQPADRDSALLKDLPATRPDPAPAKYQIIIDTSATPDLADWADKELRPVLEKWYPKIVEMLPSDGYKAPQRFTVQFRADRDGVADTSATHVNCYARWFRANLKGEAKGAAVHEMVHVVQQYGRVGRRAAVNPGWLVEGIADYIRWYIYEPESRGADVRDPSNVRYNDSYRPTANFINWVSGKYDKDLVLKLNTAMRQGKYNEELWKQYTGKTADELGEEWKQGLESSSPRTVQGERQARAGPDQSDGATTWDAGGPFLVATRGRMGCADRSY